MSTPATPPPTGPNKADPDTLALRASPRPVTRLNRRMLAVLAGTLGAVVLGGTLWSLQSHKRERNAGTELYNVDRVSHAENLDQLPKDYSKVPVAAKPVPVLGEPLPGDLGPAIVAQRNAGAPAQTGRIAQPGDAEEAARSGVFFRSGAVKRAPSSTASTAMPQSGQPATASLSLSGNGGHYHSGGAGDGYQFRPAGTGHRQRDRGGLRHGHGTLPADSAGLAPDRLLRQPGVIRPAALLHRSRRSSGLISLSRRLLNTGRMSRSRMLLRIDRVLSAIRAPTYHSSVNSWKVLASDRRRFSRCFSCAGDCPSETARFASMHFSRACASDRPPGP